MPYVHHFHSSFELSPLIYHVVEDDIGIDSGNATYSTLFNPMDSTQTRASLLTEAMTDGIHAYVSSSFVIRCSDFLHTPIRLIFH